MKPYEVVDTGKDEFIHVREDVYQKGRAVVLLPINVGTVKETENGWLQTVDGRTVQYFSKDEIVWK